MGIHDHMQKIDEADTILIGVWTRSNYKHDRVRHNTRKVKSFDDNGGR
jgi:hypothetical protein